MTPPPPLAELPGLRLPLEILIAEFTFCPVVRIPPNTIRAIAASSSAYSTIVCPRDPQPKARLRRTRLIINRFLNDGRL